MYHLRTALKMNLKERLLENVKIYVDSNYKEEVIDFELPLLESRTLYKRSTESSHLFEKEAIEESSRSVISDDFFLELESVSASSLDLSDYLVPTWCSEVFWIIDENEYKDSEVYKRAGISKQTFSKLRQNINYEPKRDTAIQMCFGLMLNLDDALDLLKRAGYTLSFSSKRDLVVRYFLEHRLYDMGELNSVLYEMKLELF